MTISDLPAINASLNAVSTVFISAGWFWIRRNIWQRHVPCMIIALIASSCFLVGYIVYHVHVGEKSSGYTGLIAWIYFPLLITHVLLAFVTLPLVIETVAKEFALVPSPFVKKKVTPARSDVTVAWLLDKQNPAQESPPAIQ